MRPVTIPIEEVLSADRPEPPGRVLGLSREGREVVGHVFGQEGASRSGGLRLSLIGGCHADEPVGPALLRRLAAWLASRPADDPLLAGATWHIVPHVNPDGEARNAAWSDHPVPTTDHLGAPDETFDLYLYVRHVVRELPGDDMEFGFPRGVDDREARPENRAVAAFMAGGAPFHLHGTFHGIGFTPGPWFLIDPAWIGRTAGFREALRSRVHQMGYRLFDVDRGGEKGFSRVDEGFSTRPNSIAMRDYFLERGDPETAAKFRPSSMEYARSLGGDPFTLVSEMPLFLRPPEGLESGARDDRHFKAALGRLVLGKDAAAMRAEAERLGIRGMPVRDQMRLQLALLNEGITAAAGAAV
ncbi:MAG TPA: M14 family zinc carboxypeptidase [Thermoanaerobaculia bacterium]|nr:M14 family zinc carboxypeptidase [Thermoanaerobaculia bacterium]